MRADSIKVSVIVLTYNHEKYIRQAMDSILKQTTQFAFEILIGDDASTDKTSQILEEYKQIKDVNIHIFRREKNIGATANFVNLINHARGEYIASCEGDDYWSSENKLQKQVDFLDSNPTFIGCTHAISLVDANNVLCKKQKLKWVKNKDIFTFKDFKGIYLPGHPVSMVYRNILTNNAQFKEFIVNNHRNIADRTIAMLLLSKGAIARLSDNMACYRQILNKKGENLTSQEFAYNSYGKLTNFRITNRLERFAKEKLKLNANFRHYKLSLIMHALIKSILYFSLDELKCFKKMCQELIVYSD